MFFRHMQEQEVAIQRRSFTLNPSNLSVNKLIINEVGRCKPISLQEKLFRKSCFMYFAFISRNASELLLPRRL